MSELNYKASFVRNVILWGYGCKFISILTTGQSSLDTWEREREFIIGDIVIIQTHSVNTAVLGQKFTSHILEYPII